MLCIGTRDTHDLKCKYNIKTGTCGGGWCMCAVSSMHLDVYMLFVFVVFFAGDCFGSETRYDHGQARIYSTLLAGPNAEYYVRSLPVVFSVLCQLSHRFLWFRATATTPKLSSLHATMQFKVSLLR